MGVSLKHSMKLFAAALAATVSTSAFADPLVGPYVAIGAGADFPRDVSSGTSAGTASYHTGYLGNLAAGYSFGNGFRPELELGYGSSRLDNTSGLGAVGGRETKSSATLNGFYDFDGLNFPLVPYVGIGGGATHMRGSSLGSGTGFVTSGTRPSVQGIVGVSYPVTPQLKLNLDYRYIETFNAKFTAADGGAISQSHGNIGDNAVLVSVRYTFGTPPAPPPPPEAAAAPVEAAAPAPAPAPEPQRAFQVFFDFDKSAISTDSAATIQKVANEVSAGHIAGINVTGHTDTVGSARYNLKLSERRADAVKQQLLSDGVPETEISTSGVGKSGLLVPTPDGVREPQNRRAEIVLQ